MNIEWYLLSIAIFLAAMGTFLSPVLALLLGNRKRSGETTADGNSVTLDVLIPAHNEVLSLPASIEALQKIRQRAPVCIRKMQIVAGLSHWSGPEANNAAKNADKVSEIPEAGKWRAIKALVANSTADWIALVDAGVVWEDNSLEILEPLLLQSDVMAINPRFQELKGGALQKIIWSFESNLKLIENKSGGPISLHGATVFYRRKNLQAALEYLEGTDWLNDDVVLPLTMRTLFPEMRIVYTLQTAVTDLFPSWDASELQRRKRLLLGNIQWVYSFYLSLWGKAPVVAILATRRLSRMMWAWWFAFGGLGFLFLVLTLLGSLAVGALLVLTTILLMVALRLSSGRRLLEAFWISLAFPFYFFSFRATGTLPRWK